jgi:hypothetical protein
MSTTFEPVPEPTPEEIQRQVATIQKLIDALGYTFLKCKYSKTKWSKYNAGLHRAKKDAEALAKQKAAAATPKRPVGRPRKVLADSVNQ